MTHVPRSRAPSARLLHLVHVCICVQMYTCVLLSAHVCMCMSTEVCLCMYTCAAPMSCQDLVETFEAEKVNKAPIWMALGSKLLPVH